MYRNPHGTCRIQYTDNQQDEASPNSTVRKHPPEYGEVISLIKGKKNVLEKNYQQQLAYDFLGNVTPTNLHICIQLSPIINR